MFAKFLGYEGIREDVSMTFIYKTDPSFETFFSSPISKNEISIIISSLNSNKSVGPNSISAKILKLLKGEISSYLSDIYNISYSTAVFLSVLETTITIHIHNKDSKLDYVHYCSISLLTNIENFLEKLVYNRITKFLNGNNLIYLL